MAVSNGQQANQTNFNNAFLSRTQDSDTIGVVGLLNGSSGGNVTNAQQAINDNITDIADLVTLSGVVVNSTDLGAFAGGTVVTDNVDIKTAIGELDTQVTTNVTNIATNASNISSNDTDIADLVTLSGVSANSTDLGPFTGTTIADSQTIKQALQALETAVESNDSDITALQATAPTADEKAALERTGTPAGSNTAVTDDDPRLIESEATFTVADNQASAANITGLSFSSGSEHGAIVRVLLRRRNDSEERMSVGHLVLTYLTDAAAWDLSERLSSSVDDGVEFSVTAAGAVQYTSDSMAGTGYFGQLRFVIEQRFGTFAS